MPHLDVQVFHLDAGMLCLGVQVFHLGAGMLYLGVQVFHLGAGMLYLGVQVFHLDAQMEHLDAEVPYPGVGMKRLGAGMEHLDALMEHSGTAFGQKTALLTLLPMKIIYFDATLPFRMDDPATVAPGALLRLLALAQQIMKGSVPGLNNSFAPLSSVLFSIQSNLVG